MIWERKSHYKGISCKTFGDANISTCFECKFNFILQLFQNNVQAYCLMYGFGLQYYVFSCTSIQYGTLTYS
jgi:hypothetical protein